MKKIIFTGGFGLLCSIFSFAQNDIDAMRYSQTTFGGTARFNSMAGSMGAIGGDFSTLSFNPAGIGVFRRSEFSFTAPSLVYKNTSSSYLGKNAGDTKLSVNIGNIGLVGTIVLKDTSSGWKSVNIGVGYNRTNDFNYRMDITGNNKESSLLDVFAADANNTVDPDKFDGFSTGLAWTTYLINPSFLDTTQYDHVIYNYGQTQRKTVESSGHMGEFTASFGGNYKEKLMVGATVGLIKARYEEESNYQEYDEFDSIQYFESFNYVNKLSSVGTGVNVKLGMIVKPNDWLRLGLAFHTPGAIWFSDHYSSTMNSDLEDGYTYADSSQDGSFRYSVITPYRAIASAGFIINKTALINIDYEYVDYSTAQLNSHPNVFTDVNSGIRSKYKATGNLRVGGEVRLDPIALRAGYAMYGSPFRNGDNSTAFRSSYTAGIGYRLNHFFMDFAYVLGKYSETSYLYDPGISKPVRSNYRSSSFILSLGFRW
ncbi:MAG: hypothetical protein K0Q95_83 [Bacteroidota bacterium]|jgi:hypothetical protein|nr:hypothetical protein [Bacteroidota bacterium]